MLFFAVVVSLFSGLYFVYKDKGNTNRAVISLTIRIGAVALRVRAADGFVLLRLDPRGSSESHSDKKAAPKCGFFSRLMRR